MVHMFYSCGFLCAFVSIFFAWFLTYLLGVLLSSFLSSVCSLVWSLFFSSISPFVYSFFDLLTSRSVFCLFQYILFTHRSLSAPQIVSSQPSPAPAQPSSHQIHTCIHPVRARLCFPFLPHSLFIVQTRNDMKFYVIHLFHILCLLQFFLHPFPAAVFAFRFYFLLIRCKAFWN